MTRYSNTSPDTSEKRKTKAGKSILQGAKEALDYAKNNKKWIIIAVTQDESLILDASPDLWNQFQDSNYAEDHGIIVPEVKKGIYKLIELVYTTKVIATYSLGKEAGWYTISGKFELLYEWDNEKTLG